MPKLGEIQINARDYEAGIQIEQYHFFGGEEMWAVPAWEERGASDLVGPFKTVKAARAAIAKAGLPRLASSVAVVR